MGRTPSSRAAETWEQELKPTRWISHALKNLTDREILREQAEQALAEPERIGEGHGGRKGKPMRVTYDQQSDTLTITLREDRIRESDEVRPGVIADFGYDGGVVRFEILDASKVVQNTREMQFALAE